MAADERLKIVTGEVRFSFVHLFTPHSMDEDKEKKFSCMILVPKSDTKTVKAIKTAQFAALEAKVGKGKVGTASAPVFPKGWKNTFRDGDEEKDTDEYPEYEGHYFMNISANVGYPPAVVDAQLRPIISQQEIYSGCYGRVSMRAFTFDATTSKGVSFGLLNVQKMREGEPLGGGVSRVEDDFDAVEVDDNDLI